jgi:hypothetical protein
MELHERELLPRKGERLVEPLAIDEHRAASRQALASRSNAVGIDSSAAFAYWA